MRSGESTFNESSDLQNTFLGAVHWSINYSLINLLFFFLHERGRSQTALPPTAILRLKNTGRLRSFQVPVN